MPTQGESWGRYFHPRQQIISLNDRSARLPTVAGTALPYGNGRSYGDSCLNDGGTLLHTRGIDRFIAFDPATGILTCEAGVLFSEILDLVVSQGWFLPVTPGTRFVTVGGAIANDVHGKNHHAAGTIGHHVIELELLRTDGERLRCSLSEHADMFKASIGGLGLTGVIVTATLQLKRIASAWMTGESVKFGNLDEFFAISEESERDYEYTVAWIDCARRGAGAGRGLFSRANHSPARSGKVAHSQRPLAMPVVPPVSLVNPVTLRLFNQLYYHRQRPIMAHAVRHYEPFFYPLDGIRDWNRMYGPRGFLQYQCVVPAADAPKVMTALIGEISRSGAGSFLAVLKQFGDIPSLGMMSFPRKGTTLALDFPNTGAETLALLNRLDDLVDEASGAVYPAKDARMSSQRFRRYFPRWNEFEQFRDPGLSSSFWQRVME
ncbi:FAD-binding oxidoreductase [Luteibacter anthropi]|uniref:FAD-binding oxidoreductase n=1 Tax=Luteibacter anthropi TaxID=564369 RepID=UPI002032897A|nr:FAD-binding oxidoreductase [Luteibacter anthropi]URX63030.1 FAD-binding oxidoreductase [Luteibacter anthropi]